jgi:hypothetical protein
MATPTLCCHAPALMMWPLFLLNSSPALSILVCLLLEWDSLTRSAQQRGALLDREQVRLFMKTSCNQLSWV